MIDFSQLKALIKRYYICYFRLPGHFMGDFLFAIIVGACLALIGLLPALQGLSALIFFFMIPFTYMGVTRASLAEIVEEKSLNIKEYLKLNGINTATYQAYCFIVSAQKMFIQCALICAGVALGFSGTIYQEQQMFSYGDLALLYFLSASANITFVLFVSTFFSDPKFASDMGGFFYIILSLGSFAVFAFDGQLPYYLACLFPQSGLSMGIIMSLTDDIVSNKDSFTLWQICQMLAVDFFLYLVLYWYLDQIIRDGNGVKRGYCFCISDCCKRRKQLPTTSRDSSSQQLINQDQSGANAVFEEPYDPRGRSKTVQLINLVKHFGSTKAVDGIQMAVYQGQILCLLGHNGAGKTTTINLMTGLLEPTNGDILYDDESFFDNIEKARSKIGLCCQKDIYYEKLTVKEHLELIANLRKVPNEDQPEAVDQAIKKMNLTEEAEKTAETLSGGNKRKLCLAMAILGNTKVIFLDEPTSGMDPNNRRIIWQHIKDLRNGGLTILMTTHHLDEADELADRIAIMSHGKLMALGSSDFMKRKFGVGYHLILTPKYSQIEDIRQFDDKKIEIGQVVRKVIKNSDLDEQTSNDVMKFLIPFEEQSKFPSLFRELEKIKNIRISMQMNSLEDTYVNIGLKEHEIFGINEDKPQGTEVKAINLGLEPPPAIKKEPEYSFYAQFKVIFLRKLYYSIRSWRGLVMMLLPALFFVLAGIVSNFQAEDPFQIFKFGIFLFFSTVAYSVNTGFYCFYPVYEREEKLKYAMDVMGLRSLPYWLGTLAFDFVAITLINVIQYVIYYWIWSSVNVFLQGMTRHPTEVFWVGFANGYAIITCAYMYHFMFQKALSAIKFYPIFYLFILQMVPNIFTGIARLAQATSSEDSPPTIYVRLATYFSYLVCPSALYNNFMQPNIPIGEDDEVFPTFIKTPEGFAFWLLVTGSIYLFITFVIETRKYGTNTEKQSHQIPQEQNHEADLPIDFDEINAEAQRVKANSNSDAIKIQDLHKVYENKTHAVKGSTFGVERGQIFGLLGPNGAGKSTTFNIITALLPKTSGSVKLNGYEIDKQMPEVYQNVGICPQFNCLWDKLTVMEHLQLFAGMKGLSSKEANDMISYYLDVLQLREHVNKITMDLSGGNKRKLCVANCLIGSPTLLFFDEPSTGLDPLARRFLWNALQAIVKEKNAAIVLTTHSMNEAESLAHKTGILINGKFFCIGPTEMLKEKYGNGYKVTIQLNNASEEEGQHRETQENLVKSIFPQAVKIYDGSFTQETYQLPPQDFLFSKAFEALEECKLKRAFKDFAIYNTTLEQVFVHFSRFQINLEE